MVEGLLNFVHVLSLSIFFGAVLGKIVLITNAEKSKDLEILAFCHSTVFRIDTIFVQPSVILLIISGISLFVSKGLTISALDNAMIAQILLGIYLAITSPIFMITAKRLETMSRDSVKIGKLDERYQKTSNIPKIMGYPLVIGVVITLLLNYL